MRKSLFLIIVLVFTQLLSKSQCVVELVPQADTLACGDSVNITAYGSGGSVLLGDDFNSGQLDSSWQSTPGLYFSNPCGPGPNGAVDPYLWMGNGVPNPRSVTTNDYDLSCGGTVCFDMRMEQQGGAAPCEGPDLWDEGIYLQFSTNSGTNWTTIFYFNPDTVCCGCGAAGCGGYAPSPFINWDNYCFSIPPAAMTPNTQIRWYQDTTSNVAFDHWGLDNVVITTNCGGTYNQNLGTNNPAMGGGGSGVAGITVVQSDSGDTNTFVGPQYQTSIYTMQYSNNTDTCYDTITIYTSEVPIEISTNDTILCNNQSAELVVSGGSEWYWSSLLGGDTINVGTNFTCDTCTNNTVYASPDSTTSYVVGSNLTGLCHEYDTITISVPEIDAGNDTIMCEGDTIQMQPIIGDTCSGSSPIYSWSPTTGVDDPTALNPNITTTQTRTYYFSFDNGCGCVLTDSVTIIVNNMSEPLENNTLPSCGAADGQIVVQNVGGNGPFEYSIDGGASFYIDSVFNQIDVGVYDLMVKDSLGCLSPVNIDTVVNLNGPVIDTIIETDLSCYQAQDGEIEVIATGGTLPLTYAIDSVTFFPTNHFTGLLDGQYTVVVKDAYNCISLPEIVVLEPNAEIVLDSSQLTNLTCYQGLDGEIELFGHGGTAPLSYSIDSGATYQYSPVFDSLLAGDYYIVLQDSKGCTIPATYVSLSEPAGAIINLNIMNDTCYQACGGQASAQVSGATAPYNYSWNGYGGNSTTSSNLCAGNNYLFTVIDANGCEFDTNFVVTQPDELVIDSLIAEDNTCNGSDDGEVTIYVSGGTAPYYYSINGGSSFQQSRIFSGLDIGTYDIVVVDENGCSTTSQILIEEPSLVEVAATSNYEKICVSNCINISAPATGGNGGPYYYHWNNGLDSNLVQSVCPTQNTIYAVYAEDVNGCVSNVELIELELYDSLNVDAGLDQDICPGESVDLSAVASGGDGNGFRYAWAPGASLSNTFTPQTVATPTTTTDYVITLNDNCGSPSVTDTVTVTVNPLPNVSFIASDTAGCEPFDVELTNTTSPTQFASWTIGSITTSGYTVDVTDLKHGVYDVRLKVTTPAGCVDELIKRNYLTVHPKPKANFLPSPQPTTIFETRLTFTDQSRGNVVSWDWDFAGLGTSQDENPTFQFPADTGTYAVDLLVTTDKSCEADTTISIRIGAEFNMYFPNSFTPNGDGLNDVFGPVGIGIEPDAYSMLIFDRWGKLVYETETLSTPWDGTYNGSTNIAPEGSYVVRIVANDYTDESDRNEYIFYVNLLR